MPTSYSLRETDNPTGRFAAVSLEWEEGQRPLQGLRFFEERAASIVAENDSPDIPFRYSVNPYRGCLHACAYCYARPTHEYLDLGAGSDFETRIFVKVNAAELLRKKLRSRSWRGDVLVFSGVTDCYQPVEHRYRLTRACLEACLEARNPVSVITKSTLILRDLDILRELNDVAGATVTLSIPFGDAPVAHALEPFAPPPEMRFRALRLLSESGLRTGLSIGPVVPGLNDNEIPDLLRRAAAAGARYAFYIMLRLPGSVRPVFLERLRAELPSLAGKVEHHLRTVRGGRDNDSRFGSRMRGEGEMAEMVRQLFAIHCRRLGLNASEGEAQHRVHLPAAGGGSRRLAGAAGASGPEQLRLFD